MSLIGAQLIRHSAVTRLVMERASQITVERGKTQAVPGPHQAFCGVVGRMIDGSIGADLSEATEWAKAAVRAVRAAPGGEVYTTDEMAAAEIMRLVDARKARP